MLFKNLTTKNIEQIMCYLFDFISFFDFLKCECCANVIKERSHIQWMRSVYIGLLYGTSRNNLKITP